MTAEGRQVGPILRPRLVGPFLMKNEETRLVRTSKNSGSFAPGIPDRRLFINHG